MYVTTMWTTYNKNLNCSLVSKNNLIGMQKNILEYIFITINQLFLIAPIKEAYDS